MIDNEDIVFTEVINSLHGAFDEIFVIGTEITSVPPKFPAVSIIQLNSEVNKMYSTFDKVDNVASEEYEFNVYSNLEDSRSAEQQTKAIVKVIDEVMSGLFYARTFCQPIKNADPNISRRVARYKNSSVTWR